MARSGNSDSKLRHQAVHDPSSTIQRFPCIRRSLAGRLHNLSLDSMDWSNGRGICARRDLSDRLATPSHAAATAWIDRHSVVLRAARHQPLWRSFALVHAKEFRIYCNVVLQRNEVSTFAAVLVD